MRYLLMLFLAYPINLPLADPLPCTGINCSSDSFSTSKPFTPPSDHAPIEMRVYNLPSDSAKFQAALSNELATTTNSTPPLETSTKQEKSRQATATQRQITIDPELQKAIIDYQKHYYQYLTKQTTLSLEAFQWQARASEVMLWVVLAVVFTGLAFSGYQLVIATRPSAKSILNTNETLDYKQQSELEISFTKIRITSSVIGLVVLIVSVAFLYLFLVEVYRISPVTPSAQDQSSSKNSKP